MGVVSTCDHVHREYMLVVCSYSSPNQAVLGTAHAVIVLTSNVKFSFSLSCVRLVWLARPFPQCLIIYIYYAEVYGNHKPQHST